MIENLLSQNPAAALEFQVIDESDDYIVINKPAPLIVHRSNGRVEPTLLCGLEQLLSFEIANGNKPAIITRLDRETSGIVLCAKNTVAARELAMSLQNREAKKEYYTIAHGWPTWDEYELNAAIIRKGLIESSDIWLKRFVHRSGRESITSFSIIKKWDSSHGKFSLISCTPVTGRTHQIRVHLSHLGHPIVGDKIYGDDESVFLRYITEGWNDELQKKMLLPRQALHARKLSISWNGDLLSWEAPLQSDMDDFMNQRSSFYSKV
jgi:23S rRNA pseudouridine1911/1915/1917 synthase